MDAVGNRTQMVDTSGTTSYDYDAAYQLTEVTYPNSDEATYTYDAMGNRLALDFNETTTEYEYDAADQLESVDEASYTYDDNGNLTDRGSDTFEWDYENRLTDAEIDSVDSSYEYNGDGLRVGRTIDATTVDYYWDVAAALPVILQDSDDNTYIYGLDLIARVDDQGDEEYYLYDGLGSTTGLAGDTGTVTDTYTYDVFGAIRSQTGSSTNEFTYTGEQVDGTDLQFLRARYYDPAIGRFLSQDPLGLPRKYSYVGNNPVRFVDYDGLCKKTWKPWEAAEECGKKLLGGAEWTYDNILKPIGECIADEGGVSACLGDKILDSLDYVASQIACILDKEAYFDINLALPVPDAPGGLVVVGAQASCSQGLHPYGGVGAGLPGFSASAGPAEQGIVEGWACPAIALYLIQAGIGGLGDRNEPFWEVGQTGLSITCTYVGGRLGD